jgi:hypothetical protein
MTVNHAESDARHLVVAQLDALARDLAERVFLRVTVLDDGRTLTLQVVSQVTGSRENITVAPDDNGAWWLWWSWGDPITVIDDVAAAAFKIAYVLTPQAGG